MVVRTLDELEKLGRIKFPADESFRSARFFTAADGLGFSYNENRVKGGTALQVWLKHHWEANYIVSGRGEVTDLTSGESWPLEAGVLYVVGPNDRHRLHFTEDECHISIFHPPLTGEERFDADGSYEASGPIEPTERRMFVKSVEALRRAGKEIVSGDGLVRTLPLLTKADDIGFGLSDLRLAAGADLDLGEKQQGQVHHILSGSGAAIDLTSGQTWPLGPSTAFKLGTEERYKVRAISDLHILIVSSLAVRNQTD